MLKKLVLSSALAVTCVSALAAAEVKVSGDAEITYKSEEVGSVKNAFNETEANINIEATTEKGIEFHSTFVAYDGVQADSTNSQDADMKTKEAYVVAPLMGGKAKVVAGLAPNNTYGTDAFDNGGENWKTALFVPINENFRVGLVQKKIKEDQKDKGKGDSDATIVRVDAKAGGFEFGAKTGQMTMNKDLPTEKEKSVIDVYATGEVSGLELGAEYVSWGDDFDGKGLFVSVGKNINDKLNIGLAYVTLTDGMKGGDDFAPGEILDGNVDSSATKDTSAFVLPVGYQINDDLAFNGTLIVADVLEESATEVDLSLEYSLDEDVTLTGTYATISGDGVKALTGTSDDEQTNMSVALAMEF